MFIVRQPTIVPEEIFFIKEISELKQYIETRCDQSLSIEDRIKEIQCIQINVLDSDDSADYDWFEVNGIEIKWGKLNKIGWLPLLQFISIEHTFTLKEK